LLLLYIDAGCDAYVVAYADAVATAAVGAAVYAAAVCPDACDCDAAGGNCNAADACYHNAVGCWCL